MTSEPYDWLGDILGKLEVDLFELIGDEFAPKQKNGSPERKRLLALIAPAHPIVEKAKQAIIAQLKQQDKTQTKKAREVLQNKRNTARAKSEKWLERQLYSQHNVKEEGKK